MRYHHDPDICYIMGISVQQHRLCIGLYNNLVIRQSSVSGDCHGVSRQLFYTVGCVVYLYILLMILLLGIDTKTKLNIIGYSLDFPHTSDISLKYLNLKVLILFIFHLMNTLNQYKCEEFSDCARLFKKFFIKKWFKAFLALKNLFLNIFKSKLIYVFSLAIMLILIANPSINNPGPRKLSIVYNNVQGFINMKDLKLKSPPLNMTKVHEMNGYIFAEKPDIVILNETWLKKPILSKQVFPENYKVLRLDRSIKTHPFDPKQPKKFRKDGGGVLIAHKSDLKMKSQKFKKIRAQAELLSVIFNTECGQSFTISTFYRVGTLGIENFEEVHKYIVSLATSKKMSKHILVGDFNFPNMSWPDGTTSCELHRKFCEFLQCDIGHSQLVNDPTHKSGNTLDLLFTNIPGLVNNLKVLDQNEFCLSDHFAITFDVSIQVKYKSFPKRKVYNYSKGDYLGLNQDLHNINWDVVFAINDPCIAWDRFKHILITFCDQRIPKRTTRSQFQPPWYDTECDKIRREKEKWRIKSKETNDNYDYDKFRECRKLFKNKMNEKMRLNFVDDSDNSLISKNFWRHVKSRTKSTRIPETVSYDNRFRSDPTEQANLFNEYFFDQFSSESKYDIDIDCSGNNFFDLKFDSDEVYHILRRLNPSKAPGPDGINGKVLKNCARSLCYPLSILFNLSFVTGCIPPDWKLASVVPVFKKGDKNLVENYRPISLTSLVMKVFERCVRTALFVACSNKLDARQHGFLADRSCITQMIPFMEDLSTTINEKSRSDIIYFDFAKAFDSVSHDLILIKLRDNFNVNGLMLKFVKAYLEGRQQQVVVGGYKSSMLPVRSGVPQGSILGPLLFVLFINDLFSCISSETNIALYADDTKIWRRINMFADHFGLQADINKLYDWSLNNKMVFHPRKCKALSVSMQRNVLDNLPFNIFIYELNGTLIDYVQSQSDLGVKVNSKLTWGQHLDDLISKANSRLGLLKRTCHFSNDKRQKRAFYLAMVRSIFEHCSQVWSPQYTTHILKCEIVQKRAIKWINGENFASYSNEKYYKELKNLNILPMKLKFIYNDLVLFYKVVNKLVPIEFPSYISVVLPETSRYTRSSAAVHNKTDVSLYSCNILPTSDTFKHSYFYRTVKNWNKLPMSIRQSEVLSKFKGTLKSCLWSSDTEWPD